MTRMPSRAADDAVAAPARRAACGTARSPSSTTIDGVHPLPLDLDPVPVRRHRASGGWSSSRSPPARRRPCRRSPQGDLRRTLDEAAEAISLQQIPGGPGVAGSIRSARYEAFFVLAPDVEAQDLVLRPVLDDGRQDGLEVARVDQVVLRPRLSRKPWEVYAGTGCRSPVPPRKLLPGAAAARRCAPRAADAWRTSTEALAARRSSSSPAAAGACVDQLLVLHAAAAAPRSCCLRPASAAPPASARNSRARENHATTIMPSTPSAMSSAMVTAKTAMCDDLLVDRLPDDVAR